MLIPFSRQSAHFEHLNICVNDFSQERRLASMATSVERIRVFDQPASGTGIVVRKNKAKFTFSGYAPAISHSNQSANRKTPTIFTLQPSESQQGLKAVLRNAPRSFGITDANTKSGAKDGKPEEQVYVVR